MGYQLNVAVICFIELLYERSYIRRTGHIRLMKKEILYFRTKPRADWDNAVS